MESGVLLLFCGKESTANEERQVRTRTKQSSVGTNEGGQFVFVLLQEQLRTSVGGFSKRTKNLATASA